MLKENATTYRRVTRIEHPNADEIYTVFHLATGDDEPDEHLSLTPEHVGYILQGHHQFDVQSNTGAYYMPDIINGTLVGVYA